MANCKGSLHSGKSCRGKSSSSLAAVRDPLSRTVKPNLVATSITACFASRLFPHTYTWRGKKNNLYFFNAQEAPHVRSAGFHHSTFTHLCLWISHTWWSTNRDTLTVNVVIGMLNTYAMLLMVLKIKHSPVHKHVLPTTHAFSCGFYFLFSVHWDSETGSKWAEKYTHAAVREQNTWRDA